MLTREKVLTALSRHQITIKRIRGNQVFAQNDYCIELEDDLYKLSHGGHAKANFKDSYKMCEAIKKKQYE